MDVKAHSGHGTSAVLNKGELGLSDSQSHAHFTMPETSFQAKDLFSTFPEVSSCRIFFLVTTLETDSLTKQITVRSSKLKP